MNHPAQSARLAKWVLQKCEALGHISDEPGNLTRTFASPAMRQANRLVAQWMRVAGMATHVDAIGNIIGRYPGHKPNAKILLLGSHLDTVPNAGKFDGPLGVLLAIACVAELSRLKRRLPFAIHVIGFCDEEGVRFQTSCLGSKAVAGCLDSKDLRRKDTVGNSIAEALQAFGSHPAKLRLARFEPENLLAYFEPHIEQGPVLECNHVPLGIVTAISGQTRARLRFVGRAAHAGTTPMAGRKDALCAAAEFVLATEQLARKTRGLAATVGQISALPGASNVIPATVCLTLDVRHEIDRVRKTACRSLQAVALQLARRRKIRLEAEVVDASDTVACSKQLSNLLVQSIKSNRFVRLPSGAGHDAAVMAGICPAVMLFIRCKNGISHHPDESVAAGDVTAALKATAAFIELLAAKHDRVATTKIRRK